MPRTVLITGCSTGIGHAAAKVFQAEGWNVIATMRRPDAASDLAMLDNVLVTGLDVTDPAGIRAAIDAGIARFGDIDMVVNNAGFGLYGVFEALSDAQIRALFETNLFGVMNMTRAILPHFRQKGAGVIVNVSSAGGLFSMPLMALYCSSKFALEGYSEGISHELRSVGITVKVIEPGGVMTTAFDGKAVASLKEEAQGPAEYAPFIDAMSRQLDGMRGLATSTEAEVGKALFDAATDGTQRLRYVVTEDIAPLVRLRQEASEEEYMAFMREHVAPKLS
ncbi:MAG TPA: SDR family oxidoreductase [Rhizobium sp.]